MQTAYWEIAMKSIVWVLFAFVFTISAKAQQYGWINISANIPDFQGDSVIIGPDTLLSSFDGIHFISDDVGWVTVISEPPIILHTGDGGMTWTEQSIGTVCQAIYMVDDSVGYAGGEDGILWRTTNGGANWSIHGYVGSTWITDIDFPNGSDTGYVSIDNNMYIWQVDPSGVSPYVQIAPNFSPTLSALAVNDFYYCSGIHVYHCQNQVLHQEFAVHCEYYQDIWFANADSGFVIAECNVNGYHPGPTYPWNRLMERSGDLAGFRAMDGVDGNHIWIVGDSGLIFSSSNAGDFLGQTSNNVIWDSSAAYQTTINDLQGVCFTSLTNGYCVGENNTILKYTLIPTAVTETQVIPQLQVHPNPAADRVIVTIPRAGKASLLLRDLRGNLLSEQAVSALDHEVKIDIEALPAGLYQVELRSKDLVVIEKLIIIH